MSEKAKESWFKTNIVAILALVVSLGFSIGSPIVSGAAETKNMGHRLTQVEVAIKDIEKNDDLIIELKGNVSQNSRSISEMKELHVVSQRTIISLGEKLQKAETNSAIQTELLTRLDRTLNSLDKTMNAINDNVIRLDERVKKLEKEI